MKTKTFLSAILVVVLLPSLGFFNIQPVAAGSTICGQYVITRSENPPGFVWESYRFVTSDENFGITNENPFQDGGYYRIYDAVIIDQGPANGRYIRSWSGYEQIGGFQDCVQAPTQPPPQIPTSTYVPPTATAPLLPPTQPPLPTQPPPPSATPLPSRTPRPSPPTPTPSLSEADLYLLDYHWEPALEALKPSSLIMTVVNAGQKRFDPGDGHYRVEVRFILPLGDEITLFFDSENLAAGERLSPASLAPMEAGESATFTIHDLTFPSAFENGAVEVFFAPETGDYDLSNNRRVDHLDVGGAPLWGAWECLKTLQFALSGGILSAAEQGLASVGKEVATGYIVDTWVATGACVANQDSTCVGEKWAEPFKLIRSDSVFDLLQFVIETGFGFVKDAMGCTLEVFRLGLDLVGRLSAEGVEANAVFVGSPVHVLVSDGQGRRAGFLTDGTRIEEIPDARMGQQGELEYLLYSGSDTASVQVHGVNTGTFKLMFSLSKGGTADQVEFLDVPTNPKMMATIDTLDGHYLMSIDENGDGVGDSTRAPDGVTHLPSGLLAPAVPAQARTPSGGPGGTGLQALGFLALALVAVLAVVGSVLAIALRRRSPSYWLLAVGVGVALVVLVIALVVMGGSRQATPSPSSNVVENAPISPVATEPRATAVTQDDSANWNAAQPELFLRPGNLMRGAEVGSLQQRLMELGYPLPSGADGVFGVETQTAVKEFQRSNGLQVDGHVGQATWARIQNPDAVRYTSVPTDQVGGEPVFVYPEDGATLEYQGSYLFAVEPMPSAQTFLWGFVQDGVMVWENLRDEGALSGNEYGIHPGDTAHDRFAPGSVEVWVRASINGQWSEATVITVYLK